MRKNPMANPTHASGTPKMGDSKPDANMPSNNHGTFAVKLGSGQNSKFGQGVGPATSVKGAVQPKGSKANTPANNVTDRSVKLGHTKHAVGTVPAYLKGQH